MDIRKEICDRLSEMLDNPDYCGIYQTTAFMDSMEKLYAELQKENEELKEENEHIKQELENDITTVINEYYLYPDDKLSPVALKFKRRLTETIKKLLKEQE